MQFKKQIILTVIFQLRRVYRKKIFMKTKLKIYYIITAPNLVMVISTVENI